MSYWGNTYMPMVYGLAVGAAREYVNGHGKALGHAWPRCNGTAVTDEQAFRHLVRCIAEASEGYADDPRAYGCRYERCVFDALVSGIEALGDGDWSPCGDCGRAARGIEG